MISSVSSAVNDGSVCSPTPSIPMNDTKSVIVSDHELISDLNSSSALDVLVTGILVKKNTTNGISEGEVEEVKGEKGVVEGDGDDGRDEGGEERKGEERKGEETEEEEKTEEEEMKGEETKGNEETNEEEKTEEVTNEEETEEGERKGEEIKGNEETKEEKTEEETKEEETEDETNNEATKDHNPSTPPPSPPFTLPPNATHSRKKQRPKSHGFKSRMSHQNRMARRSVQKVVIDTTLPAPPVLAGSRNSTRYSLVLFTTADYHAVDFSLSSDVELQASQDPQRASYVRRLPVGLQLPRRRLHSHKRHRSQCKEAGDHRGDGIPVCVERDSHVV